MAAIYAAKSFALANNNYNFLSDTDLVTINDVPENMKAPTTLSDAFLEASTDPYKKSRGKHRQEPAELWRDVMDKGGNVDADTARQFVNDFLSGVFVNDAGISDIRTRQPLKNLGFEMIISLYEKISDSDAKGNSLYLRELHKALDIPDAFYEKRIEPIANFLGDGQKAWLETKWAEARSEGRLGDHAVRFEDAMAEELTSPPMWGASDAKRRIQLLQFIADAYSDSIGETRVRVGLFNGQPGLKGFYSPPQPGKPEVIGLNIQELSNFQTCVGIIMHERHHASQQRMAAAYENGQIDKNHPDYKAARIFSANGRNGGYISGDKDGAGMKGYRFQPMEQDAHNAGSAAEYMVFKTYARKPGIYTENNIKAGNTPPAQKLAA